MDKSGHIYVNAQGINYTDGVTVVPVFGLHQSEYFSEIIWVWSTDKGPPKSVTPEWFQTEDGRAFQVWLDNLVKNIDKETHDDTDD